MSECQRRSIDRAGTRTSSVNALQGWCWSINTGICRSGKQSIESIAERFSVNHEALPPIAAGPPNGAWINQPTIQTTT